MTPSTRRDFLTLGVGVFAVAAFPWAISRRARLVRRSVPVMGTIADIAIVSRDENTARAAIEAAIERLRFVDATMSRFRPDSDIGRANASAAARVGPETRFVLDRALHWADRSDGAFDPCLGLAIQVWEVGERTAPPARDRFARLAGRRLHRRLGLDGDRVVFEDPDIRLDLGGIAKGHGVDLAVRALREAGITDGIVNVGGDLYAMGRSPDGDAWRVGVRSPFDPDGILERIEVRDEAVATSGDYVRAFEHGGRRYHHLLDPATGAPREGARHSLTVAAPTCIDADAAATALFGLDTDRAASLGVRVVHTVPPC